MSMYAKIAAALAVLCIAGAANALAMIEFLELKPTQQYEIIQPIAIGFLKAGYKKVPDNNFSLISEMKKIAYEKGYTYQNVEEVAKEAALKMGMTR